LQVLESREVRGQGRRRRTTTFVALVLVVGSLLAVVLGHAMLAQSQVRLSDVQAQLAAEQTVHRQDVLALAQLETPSRIAADARTQLHMITPAQVDQVPSVPLSTPLPTPKVAAAPATTTPATTTPATTTPATTTPATTTPALTTRPSVAGARTSAPGSGPPGGSTPAPSATGAGTTASAPGQ